MKTIAFLLLLLPFTVFANELDKPISNQEAAMIEGNLPQTIIIKEDKKSGEKLIATVDFRIDETNEESLANLEFSPITDEQEHELDTISGSESFYINYGYSYAYISAYWGASRYYYRPYYRPVYNYGYRYAYTCYSWRNWYRYY